MLNQNFKIKKIEYMNTAMHFGDAEVNNPKI